MNAHRTRPHTARRPHTPAIRKPAPRTSAPKHNAQKARGTQIHLGPPESQGSGGAVPRPIKDGSPRPKLRTSIRPRPQPNLQLAADIVLQSVDQLLPGTPKHHLPNPAAMPTRPRLLLGDDCGSGRVLALAGLRALERAPCD
jgi:hypothetical protein